MLGAPLSSVGSARDPCAEALQRTRARLLAQVPLLCVTPPLLPRFLSHSSAVLSIKPEKAKKKRQLYISLHIVSTSIIALMHLKKLFLYSFYSIDSDMSWFLSCDKCTHCKWLWTKAPAKCPKYTL